MSALTTRILLVGEEPGPSEMASADPSVEIAEKAIAENTRVTVPNSRPEPGEEEGGPALIPLRIYEGYPPELLAELEEWL